MEAASQNDGGAVREVYVARQPILDRHRKLFAYELLYRSSRSNAFDGEDSTVATSRVIANSYFTIGLERLVGNRRAFINFDRRMLVEGFAEMLPNQSLVIEILENVEPDEEVVGACRHVKQQGYSLALDDFVLASGYEELLKLADIVKVDFRLVEPGNHGGFAEELRQFRCELLAEKVETQAEFKRAVELGYSLFQGYFFSKPEIVSGRHIPAFQQNYLNVLKEVNRPEPSILDVVRAMKAEPSLIHDFLRYVNSPLFSFTRELKSLSRALVLLGWGRVRRWVTLATLTGLASKKPEQLLVSAFVRASCCELLGEDAGLRGRETDLFLLGMYSLVDAILDRPAEEVISEVNLAPDVTAALLGQAPPESPLGRILSLACTYERADWPAVESSAAALTISLEVAARCYQKAVADAEEVFGHPV